MAAPLDLHKAENVNERDVYIISVRVEREPMCSVHPGGSGGAANPVDIL
jgi:hypothetical protein